MAANINMISRPSESLHLEAALSTHSDYGRVTVWLFLPVIFP